MRKSGGLGIPCRQEDEQVVRVDREVDVDLGVEGLWERDGEGVELPGWRRCGGGHGEDGGGG